MAADRPIGSPDSSGSESPEEVTRMEIERLDVASDANPVDMKEGSNLRRSNSAPMFNGPNMSDESPVFQPIHDHRPRVRRFSTHVIGSPKTPSSSKGRVTQIKHEESMDIVSRETEGEREVQSAFQMSQSWDDMHLDASIKSLRTSQPQQQSSKSRFSDPLSIMPPVFPLSSSPSPTRAAGKQCFSPSTQTYRNNSMSPIPSPTRSSVTRRSMSPVLRPSNLGMGVKRKACDNDMDTISSKRIFLSSPSHPSSTASISSISSDESSPLQQRTTSDNSSVNSSSMIPSPSPFFTNSGSNSV